jgi:hypothetical protein
MSTDDSTRRLRVPRTTIALLGALGLWSLSLGGSVAHAAACDVNYIGAPGGSWQATANWSGAALPTAAQNVCIPSGAGTIDGRARALRSDLYRHACEHVQRPGGRGDVEQRRVLDLDRRRRRGRRSDRGSYRDNERIPAGGGDSVRWS